MRGFVPSAREERPFNPNTNQWLIVMKSIQTLDETLGEMEEKLKSQSANLPGRIKELFRKDKKSFDESWEGLKANWVSKCREISSLKKSINRITDEKARLRDENQGLEKSISRLQGQFSQAVQSSLSEIQSLTSANSDLSVQLQKMNGLKGEISSFKDHVRAKINNIKKKLTTIPNDGNVQQTIESATKDDWAQIDKLLSSLKFDDILSKDIIETAHQLGNNIENKRMETLECHLQELEKELTEKNSRIKCLELQSEDLLKERNVVVSDVNEEERNWFDYMKRSIMPGKASHDDCLEAFEVAYMVKGIKSAKHLCINAKEGLAEVYQRTITNEDELHEVKDTADEIHAKLKASQQKMESAEAENEYLRRKLEQEESKMKISRDEVISLQSRVHMLTQEKEGLELQIGGMKGGKEDFKEFCSNLSTENEKLFAEISRIQLERDSIFEKQQETGKKLANTLKDLEVMEEKCDLLERQHMKLKREFQEQSRELEHCSKENEELKTLLHEKEDSFSECKNEFRNIDIVNKDLEDQIFQLTNDNQKLKNELGKMKSNKKQLEAELKEKKLRVEHLLEAERKVEEKLKDIMKDGRAGETTTSQLQAEFDINEEFLEKSLHRASQLDGIVRQVLKQLKEWAGDVASEKDRAETAKMLDELIKKDFTNEEEINSEELESIFELLATVKKSTRQHLQETKKLMTDIFLLVAKTKVGSESAEINNETSSNHVALLKQTKMWLSWILKDYKKICEAPSQKENDEKFKNLKEIILKYVIASTKQLEAMLDSVSEKNCIIMLLPSNKEPMQDSMDKSNDGLLHYVRETFRANQMALEAAVGTLELVKIRGEADIISKSEIEAKIKDPQHRGLCEILKRMNQSVDALTTRLQSLITNAELARTPSTNSFENIEGMKEVEENGTMNLQMNALKQLINKRNNELEALRENLKFIKMEKQQLISELQEKDFDLGKLQDEVRLNERQILNADFSYQSCLFLFQSFQWPRQFGWRGVGSGVDGGRIATLLTRSCLV